MHTAAAPIIAMLALEHVRAVAESNEDHIQGIAAARACVGDRAALDRIEGGCADLMRQLGQPHLPDQCVTILRRVGTEAALLALGMMFRQGDTMDGLAQRAWAASRKDIEGCHHTLLSADHHGIMGRVRETMLAWRKSFSQTKKMSDAEASREIEYLCDPLLTVAAVCLLSAASEVTEDAPRQAGGPTR